MDSGGGMDEGLARVVIGERWVSRLGAEVVKWRDGRVRKCRDDRDQH